MGKIAPEHLWKWRRRRHTSEEIEKIRTAAKAHRHSPETIQKMKQVKRTPEHRKQVGIKNKRMYHPAEGGSPCEICGRLFLQLAQDHDHSTGKLRGKLCGFCNLVLAYVEESIPRLQAAIEYLKKYQHDEPLTIDPRIRSLTG